MLLFLVCFVSAVNAASLTATPAPQACTQIGENITLTPSGFSLPLTSYTSSSACSYNFAVPSGYFAYVELNAYWLQKFEAITIYDVSGTSVGNNFLIGGNFSNSQSWPLHFSVDLITTTGSQAQLSLKITVSPGTPTANIVKSYVTFPGASSVFLYSNQWNDGESYKFTSKSGKLYALGASHPDASTTDDDNWNNVFIYDGGVFHGTLAKAAQSDLTQKPYISTSNELILYCSKKVNVTGAIMVTDFSNVQGVVHRMEYVPNKPGSFFVDLDATSNESAFTLVSSRENPTNFTLNTINQTGGPGVLSYLSGGPIQNHSNSIKVSNTQLPKLITGNANTFYLSNGDDIITFNV